MEPMKDHSPATQGDLAKVQAEFKAGIGATRRDLAEVRSELKAEIGATRRDLAEVRAELKAEIGATRRDLALKVLGAGEKMDAMAAGLRQEMGLLRNDVSAKLDTAVSRMETIWRESAVLPRVIDEQSKVLRDHEQRLSEIERRRTP